MRLSRASGHPELLAIAETINGTDMTPFHEALWVKQARLGGSVAWHHDGFTHWDSPDFDEGTHGFSFMLQLYGCNASFANTSDDVRVTLNFGFHRRKSILGVASGEPDKPVVFDDARIRNRSHLILYAIDARRQRFPRETPNRYASLAGDESRYRWTKDAGAEIHDYNLQDLFI